MQKREHSALPKKLPTGKKKFKVAINMNHTPKMDKSTRICNTSRTNYSQEKSLHRLNSKEKPNPYLATSPISRQSPLISSFNHEEIRTNNFKLNLLSTVSKYVGSTSKGFKEGFGILYFENGQKFIGNFKKGVANGHGTYYFINGQKVMGIWENGSYDYTDK